MNKKKLLWMSDSPLMPTGYATVTKEVCNRLVNNHGWEVHVLAHNYIGQTLPAGGVQFEDGHKLDFALWGRGKNDYCTDILKQRLEEIAPQVFVTLLDTFMMFPFYTNFNFSPARSVFYFPSDGEGQLPQNCEMILNNMSLAIGMSKFAQQQATDAGVKGVEYIPHGAEPKQFFRLSDKEKEDCKREFGVAGRFVVGVVARNQGRKMLDRTLRAFKLFCKDRPDAVLLMHTDPWDAAATFDMNALILRFGLENRVVFTGTRYFKNFDYSRMNRVFNAFDVFFLSTSGEGWGMPTVEAMCAEIPVVVTDYTTTKEIVTDHNAGFAVPLVAELTGTWNVDRGIWDDSAAAECLITLYDNPDLRKELGANGRAAVLEEYTWDKIAARFDELLGRLIEW